MAFVFGFVSSWSSSSNETQRHNDWLEDTKQISSSGSSSGVPRVTAVALTGILLRRGHLLADFRDAANDRLDAIVGCCGQGAAIAFDGEVRSDQ